ncbi:hypothetical protein [Halocola ammonii]
MKKFLISILVILVIGFFYFDFSNDNFEGKKIIPERISSPVKEALTYYPQLDSVHIRFEFKDEIGNNFMQAMPDVSTVFKDPSKRTYLIKMTREMEVNGEDIPIEKIPRDVLLGWFAHELGHVMDYLDRGSGNMIWFGANYWLSEEFKIKAERRADIFAIEHDCADEIIATKEYILNNSSLPKSYLNKIESFYLSPERVLEIVEEIKEDREEISDSF